MAERPATVQRDDADGLAVRWRHLRLQQRTQAGESEVWLLTNLPEAVDAETVAFLYRGPWNVETMFQELTQHLGCEVNTLGYGTKVVQLGEWAGEPTWQASSGGQRQS